jgi:hypothetical protein
VDASLNQQSAGAAISSAHRSERHTTSGACHPSVLAGPYEFSFDPETTALIVIDMQRDFVDPGGFGEALGNDVSLLRAALPPTVSS